MTDRLILAYSLLALLAMAGAALVWRAVYYSRDRVCSREEARRWKQSDRSAPDDHARSECLTAPSAASAQGVPAHE